MIGESIYWRLNALIDTLMDGKIISWVNKWFEGGMAGLTDRYIVE
jgi:hypothetical protein